MKKTLALILSMLCLNLIVSATHLRGGEILIEQLSGSSRYRITIIAYLNTINTNVLFGGDDDHLDLGDGSDPDGDGITGLLVPEQPLIPRPDLGEGFAMASYSIEWEYPVSGFYIVTYSEPNRNDGIINMGQSVSTRFFLESAFRVDPASPNYHSPISLSHPIVWAPTGKAFSSSLACKDTTDYNLTYFAQEPYQARNLPVDNYKFPENFSVNKYNGLLEWDGKFNGMAISAEFAYAVKIVQRTTQGIIMGYKIRDFQVITQDVDVDLYFSDDIDTNENNRIFLDDNSEVQIKINASCAGAEEIDLSATTELDDPANYTFTTKDSTDNNGTLWKVGTLYLRTTAEIIRTNPYNILVRFTAKAGDGVFHKDISYIYFTTNIPEDDQVTTGVNAEENISRSVRLYPNPTSGLVRCELLPADIKTARISIRDISGKFVEEQSLNNSGEVNLYHLPPGFYLVLITSKNNTYQPVKLCIR